MLEGRELLYSYCTVWKMNNQIIPTFCEKTFASFHFIQKKQQILCFLYQH
jgi:hypothetical protein